MNLRRTDSLDRAAFDAAVASAVDIDRFCSSTRWALSAHAAFSPGAQILSRADDRAHVAMARAWSDAVGPYLAPLEGVWGLASPVAASDPFSATHALMDAIESFVPWRAAMVLGLEAGSPLLHMIARAAGHRYRVQRTAATTRYRGALDGGLDGYLSRRTRKFRANMRRIARRASDKGVAVSRHMLETPAEVDAWYPRVLAIERHSWKTAAGNGAGDGPMAEFTLGVLRRSAEADRVLLLVASRDGEDIGYLHGAMDGGYFRGLQMSYTEDVRALGIGNLLQGAALTWLCEIGAHTYDLGAELPYKSRWAEQQMTTTGLVIFR